MARQADAQVRPAWAFRNKPCRPLFTGIHGLSDIPAKSGTARRQRQPMRNSLALAVAVDPNRWRLRWSDLRRLQRAARPLRTVPSRISGIRVIDSAPIGPEM